MDGRTDMKRGYMPRKNCFGKPERGKVPAGRVHGSPRRDIDEILAGPVRCVRQIGGEGRRTDKCSLS